jgi:pimeloyl-ACP methyl ester carboxylesterase
MPFVSTDDDCEIYYEVQGTGPDIVFIPGFMGITGIWRHQIAALSGDYRCIAMDDRGAGRSDKPIPRIAYGVERHARDLAAVLDRIDARRVVLVGHSMGGNIACLYHLAHAGAVAGIVFVGSYTAGAQIAAAGNTLERIKAAIRRKEDRIAFYTGVGIPPDLAIEAAKWPLYALVGNAESFMAFDISARLTEIAVPCLILHGDGDVVSPLEPCATSLQSGLRDAMLEVFPGVNHCPMLEAPEATNRSLRTFLRERIAW